MKKVRKGKKMLISLIIAIITIIVAIVIIVNVVNKNKKEINAKKELQDENSLLCYYQKLIKLRKEYKIIKTGKYNDLLPNSKYIFAYNRKENNEELVVISNFSKKNIKCKLLSKYKEYKLLLSNYEDNDNTILKPYETRILYREG